MIGALLRMTRADVLERTRRFGFFVVLAACVYAANGFMPPNDSSYATFRLDLHRGVYNSAWVGSLTAVLTALFLSLVGFYLVKNAVERDRQTRVGEILAATPLTRLRYTLGKTFANFTMLAVMTLVVAVSAGITQIVRAEDTHLAPGALFAPFVFITLPVMLVTAAVAVLFETTPWLRGGFGNVVYYFVWTAQLALGMARPGGIKGPGNDLFGTGLVVPDMIAACRAAFPSTDIETFAMGINIRPDGVFSLTTFRWEGIAWTPEVILPRALWVALALAIAALAALPFDRFDPARGRGLRRARRSGAPAQAVATAGIAPSAPGGAVAASPAPVPHLGPLPADARGAAFARLVACTAAEVKLALRGQSRWWTIGWAVLAALALFLPYEGARLRAFPLLWIWPVLLWSPMGTRETRHGTDAVLFASPHPLGVQLSAVWLAGFLIAAATGLPIAARFALAGDAPALFAWAVGAAFIPSLALALGVWTGSSRAFEAFYTLFWYSGPLQPIPPIDFMGISRAAVSGGTPIVFAVATAVLLALAFAGRRRQLQR